MKIKMKCNARGSDCNEHGVQKPVEYYLKDEVYTVGESLGKAFVEGMKVANKVLLGKSEKKDDSSKSSAKGSKRTK